MNDADKRELAVLKQRQQALENLLHQLGEDIRRVEMKLALDALRTQELERLKSQETTPAVVAPTALPKAASTEIPPVIEPLPKVNVAQTQSIPPEPSVPSEPKFTPQSVEPVSSTIAGDQLKATVSSGPPPVVPPLSSRPSVDPGAQPKASFEMRLGTYWFVRIGAVLILTGLVFFGNLAYQKMGAGGKVSLLYLAGGLLLGAGAWWQRKAAGESMRNYAQVLFSGGLAAIYFTTYAAHHLPALRIAAAGLGCIQRVGGGSVEVGTHGSVWNGPRILHVGHHERRRLHALLEPRAHACRGVLPCAQPVGRLVVGESRRDLRELCVLAVLSW